MIRFLLLPYSYSVYIICHFLCNYYCLNTKLHFFKFFCFARFRHYVPKNKYTRFIIEFGMISLCFRFSDSYLHVFILHFIHEQVFTNLSSPRFKITMPAPCLCPASAVRMQWSNGAPHLHHTNSPFIGTYKSRSIRMYV